MGIDIRKGSKTDMADGRYRVRIVCGTAGLIDAAAVLLGAGGKVRGDDDFVFFNNPNAPGVALTADDTISIDLTGVPRDIDRVVISASTEAQNCTFANVAALSVEISGAGMEFEFHPVGLSSETVVSAVAFYRRGGGWRLDAIGQGYSSGLAAFATDYGIVVDEPGPVPSSSTTQIATQSPLAHAPASPVVDSGPVNSVDFRKVRVTLDKTNPDKVAKIDLRKSQGDPSWILTVGLEWDGRGARYESDGRVKKYGEGDLDVYFFCRNEVTNDYVIISGEPGHQGSLDQWPHIHHYGDSRGPGNGNKPAVEQVRVLPMENGDLLLNVYQSIDNGLGAINSFGRPRVIVRYGKSGPDGLPGWDCDEIRVNVGNSRNSYWATVAHIDVQDGILTVDGKMRYGRPGVELMPGLNAKGKWVREPEGGPIGQSKRQNRGIGLDRYFGRCDS